MRKCYEDPLISFVQILRIPTNGQFYWCSRTDFIETRPNVQVKEQESFRNITQYILIFCWPCISIYLS